MHHVRLVARRPRGAPRLLSLALVAFALPLGGLAFVPGRAEACPSSSGWMGIYYPADGEVGVPLSPEIRHFGFVDDTFTRLVVVREDANFFPGDGDGDGDVDERLVTIGVDDAVAVRWVPARLEPSTRYEIWTGDVFCSSCGERMATFETAASDPDFELPAPVVSEVTEASVTWDQQFCYADTNRPFTFVDDRGTPPRWIYIHVEPAGEGQQLRPRVEVRFDDPQLGIERLLVDQPPVNEVGESSGVILSVEDVPSGTELRIRVSFVAPDGTEGPATETTYVMPLFPAPTNVTGPSCGCPFFGPPPVAVGARASAAGDVGLALLVFAPLALRRLLRRRPGRVRSRR